jgi:hypothetical protein
MYTKELKQLWLHMVLFHELTITCMIVNDHKNAFFVIYQHIPLTLDPSKSVSTGEVMLGDSVFFSV